MEARLYKKNPDRSADCRLCRHGCHIKDGGKGVCHVRQNDGGALQSIFYGRPVAMAVDPIEKKPLYHFHPGSRSFSIATLGCNFQCPFCQNWDISQYGRGADAAPRRLPDFIAPEDVARRAFDAGCKTIAYTYSEPTVFFEYAYDCAMAAKEYGIKNVFVTNGFMTREMLDAFHPLLHAANVDLKAFNPETYRTLMKADLAGVLDSIRYMKELGIWIEITTLIVTGMNDGKDELAKIAGFIAEVGPEIPWHVSRFHPDYMMTDREATGIQSLLTAYELGKKAGLRYVYPGNVHAEEKENTFCCKCGAKLVERSGFSVTANKIGGDAACYKCGAKIDGVF